METKEWRHKVSADCQIAIVVDTKDIDFFTRIFEAADGVGVVTTLDRASGELVVLTTPETRQAALELLQNIPRPFKISI